MRWVLIVSWLCPGLCLAEAGCQSSFNEFLSRFDADRTFQENNIVYPLKHSYVDSAAEPEPRVVHRPLPKSEVARRKQSVYPSSTQQKEASLVKDIKRASRTRSVVQLHKPDTGYLLIYHFENVGGCWKLVEFEDAST